MVKIRHHDGCRCGLVFANHHDLINEWRFFEGVFQYLGMNVLPKRSFEDDFFPVGDAQLAFGLNHAHVAGMEPASSSMTSLVSSGAL